MQIELKSIYGSLYKQIVVQQEISFYYFTNVGERVTAKFIYEPITLNTSTAANDDYSGVTWVRRIASMTAKLETW